MKLAKRIRAFLNPDRARRVEYRTQDLAWLHKLAAGEDPVKPLGGAGVLQIATVKACVSVIAETIASLPWMVFRRTADGGRTRAEDHPVDYLLHAEPNPEMSAYVFRETILSHVLTHGNAYARIEWGGNGQPRALWPLDPNLVEPVRDGMGNLGYRVTGDEFGRNSKVTGTKGVLAVDMIHVPGLSFDGRVGFAPVTLARRAFDLARGLESFSDRALEKGAWLAYVLQHPEHLDPEAAENLRKTKAALANDPNGILVLEEGMELKPAHAMPTADALFLTSRQFQRREIAAWFRVPPHLVGDLEGGASYSSVEQMHLAFTTGTLAPWLARLNQEAARKLLRADFFADFVLDSLLRGDTVSRFQAYAQAIGNGILAPNEVRALENRPPVEGGDKVLRPLNLVPLDAPPPPPPPPPPPAPGVEDEEEELEEDDQEERAVEARRSLLSAWLEDALSAILEVEGEKRGKAQDGGKLATWAPAYYSETLPKRIAERLRPIVSAAGTDATPAGAGARAEALAGELSLEVSRAREAGSVSLSALVSHASRRILP